MAKAALKVARIYLRVSTEEQDPARQAEVESSTRTAGYYVAGVYREKASGARADRPELLRMIHDLQLGEVVVAERIDRISRFLLAEAERLVESIRAKGAKLAVPGLVDLSDFAAGADGAAQVDLESGQELLLKLALQMARDDYGTRRERQRQGVELAEGAGKYPGRAPDTLTHQRIVAFRASGQSISRTASLTGASPSQGKLVWARHREREAKRAAQAQKAMHCRCGNAKILAHGLCWTCYSLKRQDEAYFGGLREKVLERDGYRCRVCAEVPAVERMRGAARVRPPVRRSASLAHPRVPGVSKLHLIITLCAAHHVQVSRVQVAAKPMSPLLLKL